MSEDQTYRNAIKQGDKQNARIEHDRAVERVMNGLVKDDLDFYKKYKDDPRFGKWLADTSFGQTYESPPG